MNRILFPLILAAAPHFAAAATFYVSTSGSDLNSGTQAAPFQTIQHAAGRMNSDDTCLIHAGTYRETVMPNSGTTFAPDGSGPVVVSGADQITGFSQSNGSIYTAPFGWDLGRGNNQLFVDGQMVVEARYPTTPLSSLINPNTLKSGSVSISDTSQPLTMSGMPQGNWNGATIVFVGRWLPVNGFFFAYPAETGRVTSSGGGSFMVQLDFPYDRLPTDGQPVDYYLSGSMNALTSAGQWIMQNGTLSLWTPSGDNPANHAVEAKRRSAAFNLNGKSNVTIRGLGIFAANITMDGSSGNNMIDGIHAQYVSHFTLIDGLTAGGGSDPEDSHLNDTGIILSGSGNTLQNSLIEFSAGEGVAMVGGSNHTATNNIIHDTGYAHLKGSAIGSGVSPDDGGQYTYNNMISYNTMYNTLGQAVEFSSQIGLKILHNDIHHTVQVMYDDGSLYGGGRHVPSNQGPAFDSGGLEIAYNKVHDTPTGTPAGGMSGIYIDGSLGHAFIHHNLLYNVYVGLVGNNNDQCASIPDYYYNNTVQANGFTAGGWTSPCPASNWVYQDNIFYNGAYDWGIPSVPETLIDNIGNPGLNGNFQLTSPSPGSTSGLPSNATSDHGAFPFGQTAWTAGSNNPSVPPAWQPPSGPPPPTQFPDLIVTALSFSNGAFTATVKNQGTADTPGGVIIGVGYFLDQVDSAHQLGWGIVNGPLAAGASIEIGTGSGTITIPSGNHTVIAYVDDAQRITESNENNNQFTKAFGTVIATDLNGDGVTNVVDVQLGVNQALGAVACSNGDVNHDGACNVVDVQQIVNRALGL